MSYKGPDPVKESTPQLFYESWLRAAWFVLGPQTMEGVSCLLF